MEILVIAYAIGFAAHLCFVGYVVKQRGGTFDIIGGLAYAVLWPVMMIVALGMTIADVRKGRE